MKHLGFSKLLTSQSGFTLLEVLIAMAIMVLAFASILAVESGSINATAKAKQMNIVAMLARNKMVETETAIEGRPFDDAKKEENGVFESPYEDYKWSTTIKEVKLPTLTSGGKSDPNESGGEMVEMITKLLTNFLSKALREVTVTVTYKRGEGEQKFSVSTYWVDLNREFELQPSF